MAGTIAPPATSAVIPTIGTALPPTIGPSPSPVDSGASPTSIPAKQDGWALLATSQSYFGAAWAPDGAHFFDTYPSRAFEIRDAEGRPLATYSRFDRAYWLDASHLLAYRENTGRPGATASIADFTGGVVAAPEDLNGTTGGDGLPDGQGEVAMPRVVGSGQVPHYQFAVWAGGSLGGWHEGKPVAWSNDGTKLAVVHPFEWAMGDPGWLEVLTWPGLTRLYADHPPYGAAYTVDFDPSGSYVAVYGGGGPATLHGAQLRIVSLETDTSVRIPLDSVTYPADPDFFWTTGSQLFLIVGDQVNSYDTVGNLVDEQPALGPMANASADGSTVAYAGEANGTILIDRDGSQISQSEFGAQISQPWFSPDGRVLLLYGTLADGSSGLYLKRL